jgi:hypothetical protein
MTDLLGRIRSRGHWHVIIRPTQFDPKRIKSLSELEQIFDEAHVQLRGWDYPHSPRDGKSRHSDYIEGTADWESYHELWRLYQSGQFVHFFSMREDWWAESALGRIDIKPGEVLSLLSTLYSLTEIFTFGARLAEAALLGPEVAVAYKLVRLEGRQLQVFDDRRVPLEPWRKAAADLHAFGDEIVLPTSQLIATYNELAVDQARAVFERFDWSPPREMVVEDQRRLLNRGI